MNDETKRHHSKYNPKRYAVGTGSQTSAGGGGDENREVAGQLIDICMTIDVITL